MHLLTDHLIRLFSIQPIWSGRDITYKDRDDTFSPTTTRVQCNVTRWRWHPLSKLDWIGCLVAPTVIQQTTHPISPLDFATLSITLPMHNGLNRTFSGTKPIDFKCLMSLENLFVYKQLLWRQNSAKINQNGEKVDSRNIVRFGPLCNASCPYIAGWRRSRVFSVFTVGDYRTTCSSPGNRWCYRIAANVSRSGESIRISHSIASTFFFSFFFSASWFKFSPYFHWASLCSFCEFPQIGWYWAMVRGENGTYRISQQVWGDGEMLWGDAFGFVDCVIGSAMGDTVNLQLVNGNVYFLRLLKWGSKKIAVITIFAY